MSKVLKHDVKAFAVRASASQELVIVLPNLPCSGLAAKVPDREQDVLILLTDGDPIQSSQK